MTACRYKQNIELIKIKTITDFQPHPQYRNSTKKKKCTLIYYYTVPTSNTLIIHNLHCVPIGHKKKTPTHEDLMSKQRLPAASSKNANCKHGTTYNIEQLKIYNILYIK